MIPDSLFLKVMGEEWASGMWKKVKEEYEQQSQMLVVDLRRKLLEKKCNEGEDIATHLDEMQKMFEKLVAIGGAPEPDSFTAMIMGSCPPSIDPYLATLTATSALLDKKLLPQQIIRGIKDEAERCALQKGTSKSKEVAFSAQEKQKKQEKY
jgi:hypothetical protein